jgi:hypothetical protein
LYMHVYVDVKHCDVKGWTWIEGVEDQSTEDDSPIIKSQQMH